MTQYLVDVKVVRRISTLIIHTHALYICICKDVYIDIIYNIYVFIEFCLCFLAWSSVLHNPRILEYIYVYMCVSVIVLRAMSDV